MAGLVQVAIPNHLGDAVMALPYLQYLGERVAPRPVRLVGRPLPAKVLDGQGPWEAVAPNFLRVPGGAGLLLAPSFRVAWSAWRAGLKVRVGTPTDARSLLLTHLVRGSIQTLHQSDVYRLATDDFLQVLGAATGRPESSTLSQPLAAQITLSVRSDDLVGVLAGGAPDVLLHPWASGSAEKRWGLAKWRDLGLRLQDELGCRVVVTGGPDAAEHLRAGRLAAALDCDVLAGPESLPPLAWARLARECRLVVLPDTGLAHLASAAGCRPLVLFGATDPAKYAPASCRIVREASMAELQVTRVFSCAAEELRR